MLKITKGLKKKKKGKKSKKNKEEELFKPEELEAYRQQHQQQTVAVTATSDTEPSASGENDEWRKFAALTAGVDNVLKKTQGDLDRIKSTSFFQRVPPPSEVEQKAAEEAAAEAEGEAQQIAEAAAEEVRQEQLGVVVVSESETETEEEEDIFDTSFVDAVASGEVKLAYIPESPTEEETGGDDPFDTSIAERAILGPAVNSKGRKLVPLGAAVEVLTGRIEQVTCATKRPSPRRNRRQQDLLFDIDDNGNATETTVPVEIPSPPQNKTLLDDDTIPLEDIPIDLSINLSVTLQSVTHEEKTIQSTKDIVAEFDVIKGDHQAISNLDEDDDDEFALLAAESLTKKFPVTQVILKPAEIQPQEISDIFEVEFEQTEFNQTEFNNPESDDIDPFDTTFAENILPGKAELKIIENEILNTVSENVPSYGEKYSQIIKSTVSIHLTNPTGERESISSLDRVDESCLNSLQPIHRDLLGGSNTDLSNIGDDPIVPNQPTVDDSFSDYSDPFDTSLVEQVTAPGQAELKFIEKEILGEVTITRTLSDPDFNPRDDESNKQAHRPDILLVNSVKSVAFAIPSPNIQPDLLATGDEQTKHTKPLTPYYVRENSVPEQALDDDANVNVDPFDTSFIATLAPGKVELKLIENEFLNQETPELKRSLSDEDFDPRAEEVTVPIQQVPVIPTTVNLTLPLKQEVPKPDLLAANDEDTAKVLTPAVEQQTNFEDLSYSDPFDTSIASNILPGKTELKLLENELINAQQAPIKRVLTDPEFDPRNAIDEPQASAARVQDLLASTEDQVSCKPLTPIDYQVSFEVGGDDDFDPFDTSVADNLAPGKTELKLLESELI